MSQTPRPTPDAMCPVAAAAADAGLAPGGHQRRRLGLAAASLLLGGAGLGLSACGGGGEGATMAPAEADPVRLPLGGVDSGGTGAAMMASFVSGNVGSTLPLTVNGVAYDTQQSQILDADDRPLPASALLPGMGCQIDATAPAAGGSVALAQSIRVGEQLLAPVATLDVAGSSFTALGQRVVCTAGTRFDAALAAGLSALQPGQPVQVWGQLDIAGGRIVATRVGLAAGTDPWVVRGVMSHLDRASGQVSIGALQAGVAGGDTGLIPVGLQAGDVVRARLSADGAALQLLSLRGDALRLPDRVDAELEGRVTRVDSARVFAVDGVTVDATAASQISGAALLLPGARVVVRGRAAQGVLLAASVSVEPDEPVQLEGVISAADATGHRFVLRGITVSWSASTVFEGGSARLLRVRGKAAVIGRWNADHTLLLASHIHVEA